MAGREAIIANDFAIYHWDDREVWATFDQFQ